MSEVTIGPKSRSILIQVAFKAAVELEVAGKGRSDLLTDTNTLYGALIGMHEEYEAGDEPRRGGGGGGWSGGSGGGDRPQAKVANTEKTVLYFDYFGNGEKVGFYDQRPFKGKQYKATAADFQSVDNIENGERKSLWLKSPNGTVNTDVVALLSAAEQVAATAPF